MVLAPMPRHVRSAALTLPRLPCYLYDLPGLAAHAADIRAAVGGVQLCYAAKANPDAPILTTLAPHVDGFEVSSGGELAHLRQTLPKARLAFGGPGKTDEELELALRLGIERVHVESPHELRRLAALSRAGGRVTDILLRANLDVPATGAALAMSGPFGMDGPALAECAALLPDLPWVRLRGVHTHLASGLDAPAMLGLAGRILRWALPWLRETAPRLRTPEINLGGGMAVDYARPGSRFDWAGYAAGLADHYLARSAPSSGGPPAAPPPAAQLRLEPGRALTAYCGWYVTDVLDLKSTRGESYAVLRGGTHHLRTPVAKGHDQPFAVIPRGSRALAASGTITLVGQLCTPKDVFARAVPVDRLAIGDLVAFALAGAYAWNISHHDFLMHPKPDFRYLMDM